MSELTEIVDEPTVLEVAADVDRWTKYGHDRLYIDAQYDKEMDGQIPGKANVYIDLKAGEAVLEILDTYGSKPSHELEMDVGDGFTTLRNGNDNVVLVIDLVGGRDLDEEGSDDSEGENPGEGDEKSDDGERDLAEVTPETADEDYEWIFEGQRYANYRIDRDRYEGENTYGVHQATGPGILWHQTTVERVGDVEYKAASSCPANEYNDECSHVHAVIARAEDRKTAVGGQ